MLRTFTAASILALVCAMPLHEAAAQDPIAGGILGGVAGGLLGGAIGGRGGAVAGAIIFSFRDLLVKLLYPPH